MRRAHWRLTPNATEEAFVREAARREGRELSQMLHRLLGEAIVARQIAATEVNNLSRLAQVIRGEPVEPAPQH
jgi:hypothetical protein